jgi:hypothetical protein
MTHSRSIRGSKADDSSTVVNGTYASVCAAFGMDRVNQRDDPRK